MKVTLITHTLEPEKIIAASAKLCYANSEINNLLNGLDDEKTAAFVEMLATIGHESPIEHITFTFGIEGVSRSLLAQITRHRIASFSVQSQRYVKNTNFKFITPPEIANIPEAERLYQKAMNDSINKYDELTEILQDKHYNTFISEGCDEKTAIRKAEKKAIEDARFVLPNAAETKIVATFNARSLYNFFKVRCCMRAQWEIKAVADEMLRLCCEVAPNIFKNSGPSCVKGNCPEGKMTCGKINEVREFYKELKNAKQ